MTNDNKQLTIKVFFFVIVIVAAELLRIGAKAKMKPFYSYKREEKSGRKSDKGFSYDGAV